MKFTIVLLIAVVTAFAANRVGPPSAYQPPGITGDTDPVVTQATIKTTICVSGYTAGVRDVSEADKKFVLKRDRATQPSEVDHLISLELGGSNDRDRNLWAQPYPGKFGARVKDKVEKDLNRHVCGEAQPVMTLKEAQSCIVDDWIACAWKLKTKGVPAK